MVELPTGCRASKEDGSSSTTTATPEAGSSSGNVPVLPRMILSAGERTACVDLARLKLAQGWEINGLPKVSHSLLKARNDKDGSFINEDEASSRMIDNLVADYVETNVDHARDDLLLRREAKEPNTVFGKVFEKSVLPWLMVTDYRYGETDPQTNWALVRPNMDLATRLSQVERPVKSITTLLQLARQMVAPLKWIHEIGIVHRGVKDENYLVIPPLGYKKGDRQQLEKSRLLLIGFEHTYIEANLDHGDHGTTYWHAAPPEKHDDAQRMESYKKNDAFSVAQALYGLQGNVDKVSQWRKSIDKFIPILGEDFRLLLPLGFSRMGLFPEVLSFGRMEMDKDKNPEDFLAATRLESFCLATSVSFDKPRSTLEDADLYLTLREDELLAKIDKDLKTQLWENSRLLTSSNKKLKQSSKVLFKNCAKTHWVESLTCIAKTMMDVKTVIRLSCPPFSEMYKKSGILKQMENNWKANIYRKAWSVATNAEHKDALADALTFTSLYSSVFPKPVRRTISVTAEEFRLWSQRTDSWRGDSNIAVRDQFAALEKAVVLEARNP
eukprot:GHVS01075152.1.p1 GENE.GHVS01075152.1~~GHVS01075152.1.p1  ORF type:complete len:562 (-),score=51.40 GHVS01075152.1:123-1787(-)